MARTSHRLSGGLYVSGPPEKPKERPSGMPSTAVPYTGGDVRTSGELGKMLSCAAAAPSASFSAYSPAAATASYAFSGRPHSGPNPQAPAATPVVKKAASFSGPTLPTTGLITSGPVGSSRRSGGQGLSGEHTSRRVSRKKVYGSEVTAVGSGREYGFAISTAAVIVGLLVFILLLGLGVFVLVTVKKVVVLLVSGGAAVMVVVFAMWNRARRNVVLESYLRGFPDSDLYTAEREQSVKVTGVVTCGSIPLETSYQGIPRCAYICTELHEYRGWSGRQANPNHKRLTWGLRHSERFAADFYISDNRRGLRALVKAGHGTKVVSFVKPSKTLEINKENKAKYPTFLEWLAGRSLSYEDRKMRLEEGYIKEGSSISVIGVLKRYDNILMIVPHEEPLFTGCFWLNCLLPMNIRGLVLIGDENPSEEVITV